MKKVVLSVLTALAVSTAVPAFAADMPVKAYKAPVPVESPWDIAFGAAFTTDYILRGISQTDHRPGVSAYAELDYKIAPFLTLYANLTGYNVAFATGEFDISGGGRFSYNIFGLDVGYVYYAYPSPSIVAYPLGNSISYGEFYAKPSVKILPWLTVGGALIGGSDWGNTSNSAWYYEGNVAVVLPWTLPMGITSTISGAVGRQTYAAAIGNTDYTVWNAGVAFNYKAMTLDLRYWDTNIGSAGQPGQCSSATAPSIDLCKEAFVATLKFDTTFSSLK